MNHKNVTSKRATFTKAEREYVKGIVHNLSFQRLTDNEIVQWLRDEKKIDLDRSTISKMRNQVEEQAEEWYIGHRESGAKYIAIYKERLDSLLSYQKKLHEIINRFGEQSPEPVIRAISELHRLELSLHTLLKELPGDIATSKDKSEEQEQEKEKQRVGHLTFNEWVGKNTHPRIADDSQYSDEENRQYYWDLHKKYNEYVKEWENKCLI
jgi:FAD/FMN-containing dehydrogenase